jgi:hypothetical protein
MKEMIDVVEESVYFLPLTPKIAIDYLTFKKEYEGDDVLPIWQNMIENWFTEDELCEKINALREKRINFATVDGRKAFDNAFDEIFWSRIQHDNRIDKSECKSLIGILMHAVRKTAKLTNNGKRDILEILPEKLKEKQVKEEKKQQKIDKREGLKYEAAQKAIEKMQQEMVVDPILNQIFSDIKTEREYKKPVGERLTREELDEIFIESWNLFLKEKSWLSEKKLQWIKKRFYENNVY